MVFLEQETALTKYCLGDKRQKLVHKVDIWHKKSELHYFLFIGYMGPTRVL